MEAVNDQEKRKREIEEKLQILNSKKHNLVQVLKQVSFCPFSPQSFSKIKAGVEISGAMTSTPGFGVNFRILELHFFPNHDWLLGN